MRRYRLLIALLLFLTGAVFTYFQFNGDPAIPIPKQKQVKQDVVEEKEKVEITQTSLFVPSWSLDGSALPDNYNRYIYFGVTGGTGGIITEDEGYQSISDFLSIVPENSKKFLTVKMTNSQTNLAVLQNKDAQKAIMDESIQLAKENKFDGIVFDFELFSLFDTVIPDMNSFVSDYYSLAKESNLSFALTIYGDRFYRKRPYDMKFLGSHSDEIMIMAYDFSKSNGEPGPNFPLKGREKFGYDMELMLSDFTDHVPPEKLTVLFGMYGYDWVVDEKKRPVRPATAQTLNQIHKKYLDSCGKTNCVPFRDAKAKENEMDYVDPGSAYHIIWFEDEQSAKEKTETIRGEGIGSIGYWAFGYF